MNTHQAIRPRAFVRALLPFLVWATAAASSALADDRPNVLMIAIDDLNDWVQPLGGHSQVKTPAIQSLAKRGVTFRNAHCQSPLCNSSRTSLMLSLRPSTTGIYGLKPWFRSLKELQRNVTLPQHFMRAGYETYSGAKVYHNSMGKNPPPGLGRTPSSRTGDQQADQGSCPSKS